MCDVCAGAREAAGDPDGTGPGGVEAETGSAQAERRLRHAADAAAATTTPTAEPRDPRGG